MRSLCGAVRVRRRGRSENSGDAEAGTATTVGLRPPFEAAPASASFSAWSMGMSEAILPRPQGLNSRGVDVSLLLARRGRGQRRPTLQFIKRGLKLYPLSFQRSKPSANAG